MDTAFISELMDKRMIPPSPHGQGLTVRRALVYNLEYDTTYLFCCPEHTSVRMKVPIPDEISFSEPSIFTGELSPYLHPQTETVQFHLPGTVSVAEGADQAFNIAPNSGSYIVDVLVDGISIGDCFHLHLHASCPKPYDQC
jgi:hypothetical protein